MANAEAHRLAEESLEPAGVMLAPVFYCRIANQNLMACFAEHQDFDMKGRITSQNLARPRF
jgi:hypothetical protein